MIASEARVLRKEAMEILIKTDDLYQQIITEIEDSAKQGKSSVMVRLELSEKDNLHTYSEWLVSCGFGVTRLDGEEPAIRISW